MASMTRQAKPKKSTDPLSNERIAQLEKRIDAMAELAHRLSAISRDMMRDVRAIKDAIASHRQIELPLKIPESMLATPELHRRLSSTVRNKRARKPSQRSAS
jgi:hypothetical protein